MNNYWEDGFTQSLIKDNVFPGKINKNGSSILYTPSSCPPNSDLTRYNMKHPTQLNKQVQSRASRSSQQGGADSNSPATGEKYKTTLPVCQPGYIEANLGPAELAGATQQIFQHAQKANAYAKTQNAKAGGGIRKMYRKKSRKNHRKKSHRKKSHRKKIKRNKRYRKRYTKKKR